MDGMEMSEKEEMKKMRRESAGDTAMMPGKQVFWGVLMLVSLFVMVTAGFLAVRAAREESGNGRSSYLPDRMPDGAVAGDGAIAGGWGSEILVAGKRDTAGIAGRTPEPGDGQPPDVGSGNEEAEAPPEPGDGQPSDAGSGNGEAETPPEPGDGQPSDAGSGDGEAETLPESGDGQPSDVGSGNGEAEAPSESGDGQPSDAGSGDGEAEAPSESGDGQPSDAGSGNGEAEAPPESGNGQPPDAGSGNGEAEAPSKSGDGQSPDAEAGKEADAPMIAITFDDGPYTKVTNRILDVLLEYDAGATFFVVGSRIDTYSDTLKRIYESGFEVASHTWSHKNLNGLSAEEIIKELDATKERLNTYIPVGDVLLRPPYGSADESVRKVAGTALINWSLDSEDWKSRDAETITRHVLSTVKDGDIILMHDLYESTAEAVEDLVPELVARGYRIVSVTELFESKGIALEEGILYRNPFDCY